MALKFLSPLHKATRQLRAAIERRSDEPDADAGDGHLLTYLRGYGPATVRDLVRVFGHKPSTFTGMLDRLVGMDLVRRDANPRDRRSFRIALTARGRARADRLAAILVELEDELHAQVTVAELRGFHAVMAAIARVTEAKGEEKPVARGKRRR